MEQESEMFSLQIHNYIECVLASSEIDDIHGSSQSFAWHAQCAEHAW